MILLPNQSVKCISYSFHNGNLGNTFLNKEGEKHRPNSLWFIRKIQFQFILKFPRFNLHVQL